MRSREACSPARIRAAPVLWLTSKTSVTPGTDWSALVTVRSEWSQVMPRTSRVISCVSFIVVPLSVCEKRPNDLCRNRGPRDTRSHSREVPDAGDDDSDKPEKRQRNPKKNTADRDEAPDEPRDQRPAPSVTPAALPQPPRRDPKTGDEQGNEDGVSQQKAQPERREHPDNGGDSRAAQQRHCGADEAGSGRTPGRPRPVPHVVTVRHCHGPV